MATAASLTAQGRFVDAKLIGRVGAELHVEARRKAAHLAALNVLAVGRQHLGSLDKVTRIVRLGVSGATSGDVRDQPKVADAASKLLQDVFGQDKCPCRLVFGVASLPLGTPVKLEIIFEVTGVREGPSRGLSKVAGLVTEDAAKAFGSGASMVPRSISASRSVSQ